MRDFVRKKPLRLDSTESSSSEETAPSKAPKDLLELGAHLVGELGLRDSTDTMGRWLAHHLAEFMKEAANKKKSATQRAKAREQAAKLILKIWDRRTSLPGNAYPLARYRDILRVLDILQVSANPWQRQNGSRHQILAARIFDSLCRLVIVLLVLDLSVVENLKKSKRNMSVKFLSSVERAILKDLENWLEIIRINVGNGMNLGELLRASTDEAMKNLQELRDFVQSPKSGNSGKGTEASPE
jgi:hypothetical protein